MDTSTRRRFERFVSLVERIKNSSFTKETRTVSFELSFEAGRPVEQKLAGFNEEALRSVLLDLRKVLIKRDKIYFPSICELIISNTDNQEIITNIKKCIPLYEKLLESTSMPLTIDGVPESGESVLEKWIYGLYVHEEQHEEDLQRLGIGQPLHKMNFVITATELMKLCVVVANNIKLILPRA